MTLPSSFFVTHPENLSFSARAEEMIRRMVQQGHDAGIAPAEIQLISNVTAFSDEQVHSIRATGRAAGVGELVLVDDGNAPRPGTIRSAAVPPNGLAMMDQAAAARAEGDMLAAQGRTL